MAEAGMQSSAHGSRAAPEMDRQHVSQMEV